MLLRTHRDVASGVLFLTLGALGLFLSSGLTMGTVARMGAGYFPLVASAVLTGLGAFITITGWRRGPAEMAPMQLRPLAMTVAALLSFTLIERIGLFLALTGVVVLGAFASRESKPVEVGLLVIGLNLFCWLVFVKGLGVTAPILPFGL